MSFVHEPRENLSTLNVRLSSYLDKLAAQVFDIEETIGRTVEASGKCTEPDTITNLQALDFIRQSLEDLAMMSLLLGQSEKASFNTYEITKISAKLKLNATKSLLNGKVPNDFGSTSGNTENLDLF